MYFVVANLKMRMVSADENARYIETVTRAYRALPDVQLIICPSAPFLAGFDEGLPKGIARGAQNVFWEERGSYTGEVSPVTLRDFGVSFCIVGHSERRSLGETDDRVAKKAQAVLLAGMRPILCIGETAEERDAEETQRVIDRQLRAVCAVFSKDKRKELVVAYEPRWAIGSGQVPSSNDIFTIAISIRKILTDCFGGEDAREIPILYGGSVTAETVRETCLDPGLSGVLIGRESVDPKSFLLIANLFHDR